MTATKPEIDWTNNEAVCKEAEPGLYRMVSASPSFWNAARKRKSVRDFESKHRPPSVDVERALYEALRAIVRSYDLGIFTKRDRSAMVEAIALYEAKGKL